MGECICGSTQWRLRYPIKGFYRCSCFTCRSTRPGALTETANLQWLRKGPVSQGLATNFCSECAGTLPQTVGKGSNVTWLPLDSTEGLPCLGTFCIREGILPNDPTSIEGLLAGLST